MAVPAFASLQRYIGKLLTNTNWDFNFQTIVNWLADGTTDLNVNNVTGKAISGTTGTFSSTVTANSFIGSGASLTGINSTIGQISMYAGTADPTNWLICDGRAVSRAAYSGLWAICSTYYGEGDGASTFNIPDFRSMFPRGASWSSQTFAAGAVDTTNHLITLASHGLNRSGVSVRFSGTLPGDLATTITYYVRVLTTNTFEVYDTLADAVTAGTTGRFALTAGASGTITLLNWDDPDTRVNNALGGASSGVGSFQTDSFQGHFHSVATATGNNFTTYGTGGNGGNAGANVTLSDTANARAATDDGTNGTPRTGYQTKPNNLAVNYIIRYA